MKMSPLTASSWCAPTPQAQPERAPTTPQPSPTPTPRPVLQPLWGLIPGLAVNMPRLARPGQRPVQHRPLAAHLQTACALPGLPLPTI